MPQSRPNLSVNLSQEIVSFATTGVIRHQTINANFSRFAEARSSDIKASAVGFIAVVQIGL
ncbi:hypothetical protein [Colwellia sp. Bg11-28]|uniref:hypothetical protein n=1 Tax=Colwellia sp. Bg11-28 TaxID=2058305 RepID=UPI000C33C606|nr:hypothetical protein [Colwellia sp. Bg11-28]